MENRKDSHKNIKNPPLAPPPLQPLEPAPPQLHEQEQSQPQQQPPVQRLTGKPSTSTASSLPSQSISAPAPDDTLAAFDGGSISPTPRYAPMEKADDLNEVGLLGGVETTDQDYPPGILSPVHTYAPMEKANDLNEVGFLGGVETTDQYYQRHHHHNRAMESPSFNPPGILSPRPTSLPPRSLEFFSTVGPTHPQGHDEDRAIHHSANDTGTIGSAYDRYLQNVQTSSEEIGMVRRGGDSVMPSPSMAGRGGVLPPDFGPNDRALGSGQQDLVGRPSRELLPLPPDASNTLYVEGLPSNCSKREVAHIFRPFVGYRKVRLVTKDSKQRNGDPVVLCFVDFKDPACAATARTALQGYRMDEDEPDDSKMLHIHFSSRRPGQSGGRR